MKIFFNYSLFLFLCSCALLSPNPNRGHHLAIPTKLTPFATDYCSEWPDGKREDPEQWANCCFTHDLHYWLGGTQEERKKSDEELKECVKISGAAEAGFLMYIGVRLGGEPGDASYAWGFGWTHSRGYSPLEKEERGHAMRLLQHSKYLQKEPERTLINNFIKQNLSN